MQIIVVSGRLKAAKTLTIMPRHVAMAMLLLVGLVFATSAAFSWLSVHFRLPVVQELVLALQQREARETREFVRSNLALMATRLGELQAQVLQLDTLSGRLAGLAGVEKEQPKAPAAGQGGPFVAADLSPEALQQEIDRLSRLVEARTDELAALETRLLERRARDRLLPTSLPVKDAGVGSGFGQRTDPFTGARAMHEGLDFSAETGTPVYAAAAGVVAVAEPHPEFGNMVDIDHGDGLLSRYAHLSRFLVKPGQLVRRGEPIGEVGSTGRSTGPHLHFEVRLLGVPQNPARFLRRGEEYAAVKKR